MNQKIVDLYEQYLHSTLGRREFLVKLTALAGSAAAASAFLSFLENRNVQAAIVSENDPRLKTEYITYEGETGKIRAYFAKPATDENFPGVMVIHENRGLDDYTEDVGRRLAAEDFLALAPDALSPLGGTPEDPDEARGLIGKLEKDATIQNLVAAVKYLQTHPQSTGKVGVVGFCWGGAMANQVAVHAPQLSAAVPFYGRQPAKEDVSKINAALQLHYAGEDERINAGIADFESALRQAGVEYQIYMYEGAKHAFHNDTNAERYDRQAAEVAWKRTLAFLNEKLRE